MSKRRLMVISVSKIFYQLFLSILSLASFYFCNFLKERKKNSVNWYPQVAILCSQGSSTYACAWLIYSLLASLALIN